jgi:zinc protease
VPLAAARLVVRAGSALDPAGAFGLAHLVALSSRRGAGRRTGRAIDDLVEALGAHLGGGAEEDATVHGLSAPVEVLPRLLEVLAAASGTPGRRPTTTRSPFARRTSRRSGRITPLNS